MERSGADKLVGPDDVLQYWPIKKDSDLECLGIKPTALTSEKVRPAFRVPRSLPSKPDSKSQFY